MRVPSRRAWQVRLSLAAKCQLLFGAAVVLIIAAALFVPWHRMEQLTAQLNQQAAKAVTDYAVDQHAAHPPAIPVAPAATRASTTGSTESAAREYARTENVPAPGSATRPVVTFPAATAPATRPVPGATIGFPPPRFLLVRGPVDDPGLGLTRTERRAIRRFADDPNREFIEEDYNAPDGTRGYRYARTDASCVRCHAAPGPAAVAMTAGTPLPATAAAARQADANAPAGGAPKPAGGGNGGGSGGGNSAGTTPVLGIVIVDLPSRIDTIQQLLNRVFLLTAGLLAGTLAIFVFYLITTKLILQPVRVLQETAERVSEGDLDIRSDINTGDEFQQLSETFNTMLANLKRGADQLRAVNKSLDLKLGQLAESNVALYESNRLKSEFLANVSHELRTPLNSILGFADLLKDASTVAADSKAGRYLQNIVNSGRNLLELINDLLDLAKIEAGRMEVRSEPLSIPDLFEGLTNIIKPLAEARQVAVVAHVAADVPIIQTDPAKLQQVLYNFLSNAIKFSPAGERIDLIAERVPPTPGGVDGTSRVRVAVTDRGPGIAADKHAVIFEKFRQVDASVTRQHGGTGLGLAISKELTDLLGGSIGVDSTPGEGATFWLILPLQNTPGMKDVRPKLILSEATVGGT